MDREKLAQAVSEFLWTIAALVIPAAAAFITDAVWVLVASAPVSKAIVWYLSGTKVERPPAVTG